MQDTLERLLDFVSQNRGWAPFAVSLVAMIDSTAVLSLLLPATPFLFAVGALVSTGALDFLPVWAGAAVGGAAGSTLSWWIGHHFGRAILHWRAIDMHADAVARATGFLRRWGTWAVLAGHIFAPLTSIVFLLAGIGRIPFWRFQLFNLPGVFLWAWFLPKTGEYGGYIAVWVWSQFTGP
jgi:membrane protein DedA with SNARE-associated domain